MLTGAVRLGPPSFDAEYSLMSDEFQRRPVLRWVIRRCMPGHAYGFRERPPMRGNTANRIELFFSCPGISWLSDGGSPDRAHRIGRGRSASGSRLDFCAGGILFQSTTSVPRQREFPSPPQSAIVVSFRSRHVSHRFAHLCGLSLAIVLLASLPAFAIERGIMVREGVIYVNPSTDSAKLSNISRGREVADPGAHARLGQCGGHGRDQSRPRERERPQCHRLDDRQGRHHAGHAGRRQNHLRRGL